MAYFDYFGFSALWHETGNASVGAKKFGGPLQPRKSNFFGGISRDFAGISRGQNVCPKSSRRKSLCSIFGPYSCVILVPQVLGLWPWFRCVPPRATKTCAVCPVFARVVGKLGAADPRICSKGHESQCQHFYFSHRPSPLLRGRRLSGSRRGSILSRFSVGFWSVLSHF